MPTTPSPLRYPGGKTKIYDIVRDIINTNNLHNTYIEPFAGGAGLALKLLFNNDVKKIVINDSDLAIYAFWHSVLNNPEELCHFIDTVDLNVGQWRAMRAIYNNKEGQDLLTIGKATLYLNRVNVSGVLKGGLIGGITQQGNYGMDARFNRVVLKNKIWKIANNSERITLFGLDVFDFLKSDIFKRQCNGLVNFDPPYVGKGGKLYLNYFKEAEHTKLKKQISQLRRRWIVTYDNCEFIKKLYAEYDSSLIDFTYGTNVGKKATEFMFYSKNLVIKK